MRIEFDPLNREEATAVRLFLDAQNGDLSSLTVGRLDLTAASSAVAEYSEAVSQNVRAAIDSAIAETVVQVEEPTEEPSGDELPETDKNGVAWNADLHSTPAKINKDGTWRAKRGVTSAPPAPETETSLAETAVTENSPAASADTTNSAPPAPSEAPKPPLAESGESAATSVPPAPPANEPSSTPAPAPTPPVQSAGAPSFLDVMKAVTAAQKDGKISPAQVKELAAAVVKDASSVNDLNGPAKVEERVTFLALLAETIGG